jgi:HD-like signal output (HDOD) protein
MNQPTLAHLVAMAEELRPLSGTAGKVLALSEGDRFSAQQLAEVVIAEPVLATRVLRIANSAFYGAPRRIASVREAIVLIGFPTVHATALAVCLVDACPRPSAIDGRRFWKHSVSVATLAEELAKHSGAGVDQAFTAGIIHNIGRLAFAQVEPRGFREAVAYARTLGASVHQAQIDLFGYTDADLGAALAERWDLPPALIEAIGESEPGARGLGPVAQAVSEARTVVRLLGVTDGVDVADGLVEAPTLLETPPAEWPAVTHRVDALMEQLVPA